MDAESKPPDTPSLDRHSLLERLGGDEELMQAVLRIFLEDCPKRLADIKSAVEACDAERIRTSAHALKGAAGNLSAIGLFEAARTLERIGQEGRIDAADAAWRELSAEAAHVLDALSRLEISTC
jgi:two-component system sensor histidine kinase/response regulator